MANTVEVIITAQADAAVQGFNTAASAAASFSVTLQQAATDATTRLQEVSTSASGIGSAISGAVSAALPALAALASALSIGALLKTSADEAINLADATRRMTRETGIASTQAFELIGVFDRYGVSADASSRALMRLKALGVQIGASPDTTFALPQSLPEPPVPQTSASALTLLAQAGRPEIAGALASLQAAKLGDALVDADLRPTVALSGAFGSQVSPTSFVQQQTSINNANASALASYNLQRSLFPNVNFPVPGTIPNVTRGRPGFWQFGVVSSFTLPFIDYGSRAANHRAARAQIAAAQSSFDSALDTIEADVRAALRNARTAFERLGLAKQSAGLASESARISQLQYKNGLVSFGDITQTQATAVSAENDLVAARVAYILALIKLRLALGPADPVSAVITAAK